MKKLQHSNWYNLGLWQKDIASFSEAASSLAHFIGSKAQLSAADYVLDIGVGSGDQIQLWQQSFALENIVALEPHKPSWLAAKTFASDSVSILCQPLHKWRPEAESRINKAICVDAAYHIAFPTFWKALARLQNLEVVALSDLFLLRRPSGYFESVCLFAIGLATGVPFKNFRTKERYVGSLEGFKITTWIDVSEEVIDGYCQFVREPANRSHQLFSSIKPLATAWILSWLRRRSLIGYAVLTAQRDVKR